jgi:hypothetical protein
MAVLEDILPENVGTQMDHCNLNNQAWYGSAKDTGI